MDGKRKISAGSWFAKPQPHTFASQSPSAAATTAQGVGTGWRGQTALAAPPDSSFPNRIKGKQAVINLSGAQDPPCSEAAHPAPAHAAAVRARSSHQPLLTLGMEL